MTGSANVGLWLTVIALGVYHGINPTMGWPLAVANGLTAKRGVAVFATGGPLAAGHFVAMAVVLVPFALLAWYVEWSRTIRVVAGALIILFGVYRLVARRHPRFLARVRPTQLAWWSLLVGTAHGAGLMLVPVALGLCSHDALLSQRAPMQSMGAGLATVMVVSLVHTLAMIGAGLAIAWAVYRYLGLGYLRRSWVNLDTVWGASLVMTGALSVLNSIGAWHVS